MAPTEIRRPALDYLEGGLLALAAPFLLFPDLFPAATVAALVSLLPVWLLRPAATGRLLIRTPFNRLLLLFLLAVLVGMLVSADPDLTRPKATGLLLGVTLWRTLAVQTRSAVRQQQAAALFLVAAGGMLVAGALSVDWRVKAPLLAGLVQRLPEQVVRLPGGEAAGTHANELAGTVLLCLPFSLALAWPAARSAVDRPARAVRALAAAVAVAGGALLLLSQSRAGWLGATGGLAGLLWLNWARRQPWSPAQRRRWLRLGTVACLGLAALTPLAYRWAAARATLGAAGALETVAFRFEIWRWALATVADFPLTGTGLGTFRRVVLRLYPITAFPNPDVGHAHNVFLQVALDTGLLGLAAYLGLLVAASAAGWQWLRRATDDRASIAAGVLASLLAFHTFGLADTIALGAKPGLLFWWLLGLLTGGAVSMRPPAVTADASEN